MLYSAGWIAIQPIIVTLQNNYHVLIYMCGLTFWILENIHPLAYFV